MNPEQNPNLHNESKLEVPEIGSNLTEQEIQDFKFLPRSQQEKQKREKLAKILELQTNAELAMKKAIETGHLDEVKVLKEKLAAEIKHLEDQIQVTDRLGNSFEVTADNIEINSSEDVISILESQGIKITDDAKHTIDEIIWFTPKGKHEVVSVSVEDLFHDKQSHTYVDICRKARNLGFTQISSLLVPAIRLNYKDAEWGIIATDSPLRSSQDGKLRLFRCNSDKDGQQLSTANGGPFEEWSQHRRFFFIRK